MSTSSTNDRPLVSTLSWVIDVSLALVVLLVVVNLFHLSPIPHKWWVLGLAATVAVFRVLVPRLGGPNWNSPGELAWREAPFTGGFLTVAAITAALVAADQVAFSNPLWARAEMVRLQPFMPDNDSGWGIEAFFYTLGAWPTRYHDRPIFYSLPYEKGPPAQFVGEIYAAWDSGVRITIEGPKTPIAFQEGVRSRRELQSCLTAPILGGADLSAFGCLSLREKSLKRHIEAMARVHPQSWKLQWFLVENPAVPPEEQAQGIYIEADGLLRSQARYILVTEKGTHEAIIANYSSQPAEVARVHETLEKVVSSLRVSDDLNPGRAWADRQLEGVHLDNLKTITDPAVLAGRLAEVEAKLLSKISVEPKMFDAYFHLGGVAMMIAREGVRANEPDWRASADMIQSLLRYAKDVAPQDARLTQMENLWLESEHL